MKYIILSAALASMFLFSHSAIADVKFHYNGYHDSFVIAFGDYNKVDRRYHKNKRHYKHAKRYKHDHYHRSYKRANYSHVRHHRNPRFRSWLYRTKPFRQSGRYYCD